MSSGEYVHSAKMRAVPQISPTNMPLAVAFDTCNHRPVWHSMLDTHDQVAKFGRLADHEQSYLCSVLLSCGCGHGGGGADREKVEEKVAEYKNQCAESHRS